MIDTKPEITHSLRSNVELVALLGGAKVWPEVSPDATDYPYVTFFELDNVDTLYADDEAQAADIFMQVDVWAKSNTSPIAKQVNKTMKALGWYRTSAIDLYEDDTKTFHKALRYRINKMIEE